MCILVSLSTGATEVYRPSQATSFKVSQKLFDNAFVAFEGGDIQRCLASGVLRPELGASGDESGGSR